MAIKNRLNHKVGLLTVLSFEGIGEKYAQWMCLCECGTRKLMDSRSLQKAKSCGCLSIKNRVSSVRIISVTHGHTKTRTYKIWSNIKARCNNQSSSGYYKYGGRGIKICSKWLDYPAFLKDMGEIPSALHSIERINPAGNYEPTNCKWVLLADQRWNKTNSRKITYNGVTKNLSQWAQELSINRKIIDRRIAKYASIEKAFQSLGA